MLSLFLISCAYLMGTADGQCMVATKRNYASILTFLFLHARDLEGITNVMGSVNTGLPTNVPLCKLGDDLNFTGVIHY
jgi:hypothetical protein